MEPPLVSVLSGGVRVKEQARVRRSKSFVITVGIGYKSLVGDRSLTNSYAAWDISIASAAAKSLDDSSCSSPGQLAVPRGLDKLVMLLGSHYMSSTPQERYLCNYQSC